MRRFTDIFIERPVLAAVVSLLIFLFGLRAIHDLSLREFPKTENTVIQVVTAYPGASADLIQGFITSQLLKSIASADGIDYLEATSSQNISTIKAHITLNFNPENAFTNIMSKVAEVSDQLPRESQKPIIKKDTGASVALMYIGFDSSKMTPQQITDYISRVVQPKLQTVPGVASADILGAATFAMRIWLDPQKMAALQVTPSDVDNVLKANNFQTAAGSTKGSYVSINITATTDLHNVDEFKNLIVKNDKDKIVYLRDIALVQLGAQQYDSSVTFDGQQAVFVAINPTPTANPLTVITQVRKVLPSIMNTFPPFLKGKIVYDATRYIRSSIHEVIRTIAEATLIVILVIYLFLGNIRSVIIPIVTIPLSLIGVCSLMLFLGYSLNLLTLLAMVLAIGMVVDDAIVVVENIHRHMELGQTAISAAIQGAREIALPIITMTITLAAVYLPIGFMSGLVGALFKEFAFTLACAVFISGIVALTLSPMMCSKLLLHSPGKFSAYIDAKFLKLKRIYHYRLHRILKAKVALMVFAFTVLLSCLFLYVNSQQELAPNEDQSIIFFAGTAPQAANIDYVNAYSKEFNKILDSFKEKEDYFVVNGAEAPNTMIGGLILKPWSERKLSQDQVQPILQDKLQQITGLNTVAFPLPSLPGNSGSLPLEFVVTSTSDFPVVFEYTEKLLAQARASGMFAFIDNTLKYNNPEADIIINRKKAANLGIDMSQIGSALATALGGNYVNRFSMMNQSYQVIPQLLRRFRYNPEQLNNIYLKTSSNAMIPLKTIIEIKQTIKPSALSQFQQLNSATIQGVPMPGVSLGHAVDFLQKKAQTLFPKEISYDFAGETRQYIQEGNSLIYTFIFALITIYLVLAAQFESFLDPLIILISVPMSICGALIPLNLGAATINIYTQIGLITLIGLISKHGILMVDFANHLRKENNLSPLVAIKRAAAIRLRPILMTTAAMILGVMPLLLANGAGAKSRFNIGLVIATGMLLGTLFTLFVVPSMYCAVKGLSRIKLVSIFAGIILGAAIFTFLLFYGPWQNLSTNITLIIFVLSEIMGIYLGNKLISKVSK